MDTSWFDSYFDAYRAALSDRAVYADLLKTRDAWADAAARGGKVIFVGNGGSAAVASHCSVDLTKAAGLRAINFNEADLITCFANDYGYEHWVARALECYGDPGDVAVLISSSGKSPNMVHGAMAAKRCGLTVVTLSGFEADNPLRALGSINLWINSNSYNVVEMTHHIWLLSIIDMEAAHPHEARHPEPRVARAAEGAVNGR